MASKPETLSWQPGSYTLDYILRNLQLPQVVQCDHNLCESGSHEDLGCGPPMLLWNTSNQPSVVGVGLTVVGKKLLEDPDNIVKIPSEYKGWFVHHGSKTKKNGVPEIKDVHTLVTLGVDCFLNAGKSYVDILKKTETDALAPDVLAPGEMLKSMAVVKHEKKYLQCVDEKNRTILIDLQTTGTFIAISNKTDKGKMLMFRIGDFVRRRKQTLPCVVKSVFGTEPTTVDALKGLVKLLRIENDVTFIACTVTLAEPEFKKLSLKNPLRFQVANLSNSWLQYSGYQKAYRACKKHAEDVLAHVLTTKKRTVSDICRGSDKAKLECTVRGGSAPDMCLPKHIKPSSLTTLFESNSSEEASETSGNDHYANLPEPGQRKSLGVAHQYPALKFKHGNTKIRRQIDPNTTYLTPRCEDVNSRYSDMTVTGRKNHVYESIKLPALFQANVDLEVAHRETPSETTRTNVGGNYSRYSTKGIYESIKLPGCPQINVESGDAGKELVPSGNTIKESGKGCSDELPLTDTPGRANDGLPPSPPSIFASAPNEHFSMTDITIVSKFEDSHNYTNIHDMIVNDESGPDNDDSRDYVNIPDDDCNYVNHVNVNVVHDVTKRHVLRGLTQRLSSTTDSGVSGVDETDESWDDADWE